MPKTQPELAAQFKSILIKVAKEKRLRGAAGVKPSKLMESYFDAAATELSKVLDDQ